MVAVDEGYALVDTFFDEVGGFFRKAAGCDEEPLACALTDEGAEEFLDFRAADGAVGGPLFRLDVDAVEAETIGFDDAVDAFIAGLADDQAFELIGGQLDDFLKQFILQAALDQFVGLFEIFDGGAIGRLRGLGGGVFFRASASAR